MLASTNQLPPAISVHVLNECQPKPGYRKFEGLPLDITPLNRSTVVYHPLLVYIHSSCVSSQNWCSDQVVIGSDINIHVDIYTSLLICSTVSCTS